MHTTTPATPAVASVDFRELPIDQVFTSPLNPRKTLNEEALKELAQSIREKGIIEPLVVRVSPSPGGRDFEIVAGERRYRAAEMAGLEVVPCVVRVLSDAEVVEHALTENHQRRDVHPLEEAEAIQQLLDLDSAYTIAGVAAKLGVSHTWVYGRLKLLRMSEPAREAYRANAITAEHADILARVPAHQQAAALTACFASMLFYDACDDILGEDADGPSDIDQAIAQGRWDLLAPTLVSAGELRRHVARHSTVDIADEAVQTELPALAEALADAAADDAALLQVSLDPRLGETDAKVLGVIRRGRWIEIDEAGTNVPGEVSTSRCEHMRQAAVTHPVTPKVLRIVTICTKRSCQVHRPAAEKTERHAGPAASPKETERQRQAEEKRAADEAAAKERARVWDEEQRPKYLAALAARVAKVKTLTTAHVRELIDDYTLQQIETLYGVALTPKTIVTVLLIASGPTGEWQTRRDSDALEQFGKDYGLTPGQWEKQQKAATDHIRQRIRQATKATAAKKAAPKTTAKAKKKGGR